MIKTTINLPNYRLRIELAKRRKSKKEPSFLPSLEAIKSIRTGSKISRFFRHILERLNIKAILGGNLALSIILTGFLNPTAPILAQGEAETTILVVKEQPLSTEITVQYPVNPVIINQGFHIFHWGIDLDGVTGDPVKPIMKGTVTKVDSGFPYGNSVFIDHGNGVQSLYAHLSRVKVKKGDAVETRTVVGDMGSTGRSTGDHLHLEVYREGKPVNPSSVLPKKL